MNVFIKKMLLFLLPLIALVLLFEIYLRHITTSYTVKENGLLASADSIQVLILGNSHEAYDIDPNQFSLHAYNLAQVNQSLYFDKRLTLKYIHKLPHLKFVLIGLDYHSLYFSSQGVRDSWSYYANGIEYKDRLPFLEKYSRLNGYSVKVAVNLLQKDISKKYKIIKAVDVPNDIKLSAPISKGYFPFEGQDPEYSKAEVYTTRAKEFNDKVRRSKEKDEIIKDLEDFIIQLKAKGIMPVFITPPCYGPFRQMLDQKQVVQNEADINTLSQKFNIPYWDYFNWPLADNYFHDDDHLNDSGAIEFSKLLNERLQQFQQQ